MNNLMCLVTVDPEAASGLAAVLAGCMGLYALIVLAITAFMIFCFWRIFTKAGYNGALALLNLVPLVGPLIVLCILAFGEWPIHKK